MGDVMLRFLLEPLTPLLFRKPVLFELGGYAPTLKPLPMPSTIAGMIRTALLENLGYEDYIKAFDERRELLGNPENYSGMNWILIGPYLAKCSNYDDCVLYYPTPLDLFIKIHQDYNENNHGKKTRTYALYHPERPEHKLLAELLRVGDEPNKPLVSITHLYTKDGSLKSLENSFIRIDLFERYLKNKIDGEELTERGELVKDEEVASVKVYSGLRLDKSKKTLDTTTVEGKIKGLYYQFERLYYKKGWKIAIGILAKESVAEEIRNALDNKILRLGGKGGLVHVKETDIEFLELKSDKYISPSGRSKFKLVITSPAVLQSNKQASYPDIYSNAIFGYAAQKETICGWSYYSNKPKSIHIGVKAGSVYYFDKPVNFNVFWEREYVDESFRNVFGSALIGDL